MRALVRSIALPIVLALALLPGCRETSAPELDRGVKMLAQLSLDDDADYLKPELDQVLKELEKVPPAAREDYEQAQLLILKIKSTRNRVARMQAREKAELAMQKRREELEELDIQRRDAIYETKKQRRLERRKCGGRYHNDGTGNCVRGKQCAEDYIFKNGRCYLGI